MVTDQLVVFAGSLLVGGLAVHLAAMFLGADREYSDAVLTALVGALVWSLLSSVPFAGPLVALLAGVAVVKLRYPVGWIRAALVAAGATTHAAVGTCRLQCEPLTERQALALVTVEDAASYLGIATGGLVVAAAVAAALVGLATGWSPAAEPSSLTAAVAAGALVVAGLVLATGRFFEGRLP